MLARSARAPWETLAVWAEKERGTTWDEALGRHGDWTRDAVRHPAVRQAGHGFSGVQGRIPGLKDQAAAQAVKRFAVRRERDPLCELFIRKLAARISTI